MRAAVLKDLRSGNSATPGAIVTAVDRRRCSVRVPSWPPAKVTASKAAAAWALVEPQSPSHGHGPLTGNRWRTSISIISEPDGHWNSNCAPSMARTSLDLADGQPYSSGRSPPAASHPNGHSPVKENSPTASRSPFTDPGHTARGATGDLLHPECLESQGFREHESPVEHVAEIPHGIAPARAEGLVNPGESSIALSRKTLSLSPAVEAERGLVYHLAAPGHLREANNTDSAPLAFAECDSQSSAREPGHQQNESSQDPPSVIEELEQVGSIASSSITTDSAEFPTESVSRRCLGMTSPSGSRCSTGSGDGVPESGVVAGEGPSRGGDRRRGSWTGSPACGLRMWRASAGWWPDGLEPTALQVCRSTHLIVVTYISTLVFRHR